MRPQLVAFDLDDTLAPSKSRLPERMAGLLCRLLDHAHVCVISGGHFGQFDKQVLSALRDAGATDEEFGRLHLMPTCGTRYLRYRDGDWREVYAHDLPEVDKRRAVEAVSAAAKQLGLWVEHPYGEIVEDRGSQITFSALGQQAPVEEKNAWDPDGEKKNALRRATAEQLPDLEVRAGGTTSIDITRHGIDKAYGVRQLSDVTGIPLDHMLFLGDKMNPDGNDYPVKAAGVPSHAVTGWQDTADYLERLIPELSGAPLVLA